jgi:hypothetical protein
MTRALHEYGSVIRRAGFTGGALVGLAALLVGCQPQSAGASRPSPSASIPAGDGVVVGGIDVCNGAGIGTVHGFMAGTVKVLRGKVALVPETGGITKQVLPSDQVASTRVAKNQKYSFTLPDGSYVLSVKYGGPGAYAPFVSVVVRLGRITQQNIPNLCS